MTKKERIYVAGQVCVSITGLTWVQMAYNEPSVVAAWTVKEWLVVALISAVIVAGNVTITWLSYLSDPHELKRGKFVPAGLESPPSDNLEPRSESNAGDQTTG